MAVSTAASLGGGPQQLSANKLLTGHSEALMLFLEKGISTHLRVGTGSQASSPLARLVVPAAKGERRGGVEEEGERDGHEKGEGACSEELHGGRSGRACER